MGGEEQRREEPLAAIIRRGGTFENYSIEIRMYIYIYIYTRRVERATEPINPSF